MKKKIIFLLAAAMLLLTACAETSDNACYPEPEHIEETFRTTIKADDIDSEKLKQVNGEELKSVDFTDCSIAVLDNWAVNICEYLSEEKTKEFIEHIIEAEISPEEYEGETLIYDGGGAFAYRFRITLNTGEFIYIGALNPDNISMLLINGYHGYPCDEETFLYICEEYYREPLKTPVKSKNGQGAPDTRKAGEVGLAPVETD